MSGKNYLLIFTLILILGAFLRFYNIAAIPPGLYPDEAMNGNNASEAIVTGTYKLYYPENNGREGLFINIQSLFLRIFDAREPWVLRFPSAIFGTLTILGLFFLTRELFARQASTNINKHQQISNTDRYPIRDTFGYPFSAKATALLSSFFLATSFWHVNFSRIGFRAIMAPFFLVWSAYLLLAALNKIKEAKKNSALLTTDQTGSKEKLPRMKGKWPTVIVISSGLLFGLGFHTYIAYRIAPIIVLVVMAGAFFAAEKNMRNQLLVSYFLFIISAAAAFAPLGLYYLENPQDFLGRTAQVSVLNSPTPIRDLGLNIVKTLGMFDVLGDWNPRHNLPGAPLLYWPVGISFLIGIFFSMRTILFSRKNIGTLLKRPETTLWVWFIAMMLPVVISNEGIPHALRAIVIIPPVMILAGMGAAHILNFLASRVSKKLYLTVLVVCGILIVRNVYISYFVQWAWQSETYHAFSGRYVEIGRQLNSSPREIDKYVVVNASGVDVRGLPMPAQTVMFITDTFEEEKRKEKNMRYITHRDQIPDDKRRKIVIALEPE